jgi:hypothetical protein
MRQIDKSKIWKTIARWWDCIVKIYGKDEVIKISTLSRFLWQSHSIKLIRDYKICNKYIKKYIIETAYTQMNKKHVEVQKFIQWEKLQKKHFENLLIQKQFQEITDGMKSMKLQNLAPIDLIWFHGVLKLCFDNIIVDEDFKLCIIDVALLESKSLWKKWYLFYPFMILARWVQKGMIWYHVKP